MLYYLPYHVGIIVSPKEHGCVDIELHKARVVVEADHLGSSRHQELVNLPPQGS